MSNTLLELIGNTPMVEIKNIYTHPKIKIFAKLEGQNPGGSVKDRAAYNMISEAIKRGELNQKTKLIEATSGNTGIALAMIARLYNIQIELVMPDNSTIERVQTMEAYGAKVILTPASVGMEGARDYADEQVAKGGYVMLNQFANPDNYLAHYKTTGPEIYKDTQGKVTHFVSSMGTTGTIMGTSMYLKQQNENIQIVGVQPTEGSKIPGIRRWPLEYLPKIYDETRVDLKMDISEKEAIEMTRRLAKEEGIFCGMSSGGAMAASIKLARTLDEGLIVSIICDRGDRYLSSDLFAS
jgi:cysteine synthase B